jgi:hypothetical protein
VHKPTNHKHTQTPSRPVGPARIQIACAMTPRCHDAMMQMANRVSVLSFVFALCVVFCETRTRTEHMTPDTEHGQGQRTEHGATAADLRAARGEKDRWTDQPLPLSLSTGTTNTHHGCSAAAGVIIKSTIPSSQSCKPSTALRQPTRVRDLPVRSPTSLVYTSPAD